METDDDRFHRPPPGEGADPRPDRAWGTESLWDARVLRARATLRGAAAAELRREAIAPLARCADRRRRCGPARAALRSSVAIIGAPTAAATARLGDRLRHTTAATGTTPPMIDPRSYRC